MRLVNIEPCEKLGHAMVLYATEGGMLVQIRSCDMPAIDAVPVVRCKDCKHRGDHEVCPLHDIRFCYDGDGHMDEFEDDKTEDEFFCSYGERTVTAMNEEQIGG